MVILLTFILGVPAIKPFMVAPSVYFQLDFTPLEPPFGFPPFDLILFRVLPSRPFIVLAASPARQAAGLFRQSKAGFFGELTGTSLKPAVFQVIRDSSCRHPTCFSLPLDHFLFVRISHYLHFIFLPSVSSFYSRSSS